MGLSTAERNRRKRERKKREREQQKEKSSPEGQKISSEEPKSDENNDVEIVYVAEPLAINGEGSEVLKRFQALSSLTADPSVSVSAVSDDEKQQKRTQDGDDEGELEDEVNEDPQISKRKLRNLLRPSVAELKRRVQRPDLVEAHDITAADPEFLIRLKGVPGTVPVPRHWGRKRKYLQGKRGFEKPPFQLPDFITKTGIAEIRDTVAKQEAEMSVKQKNRQRVAPKMGAIDVDYRTLYDAFFKHQTKPSNMTKFGDVYYEGKELEVKTDIKPGKPLSKALREALGMTAEHSPPPYLLNMQRYGPPPSYPNLKIPGLNAPLPTPECQYGYHAGGWGKPPVDAYGRPLYGGNPFDPPGSGSKSTETEYALVTSDGKTISKTFWGAMPSGDIRAKEEEEEDEEEESDDEEMEESEEEGLEDENDQPESPKDGVESMLPPPAALVSSKAPVDLRKQAGDETPVVLAPPKQLYQVLDQTQVSGVQEGTVFASEVAYVVPGLRSVAPEGAESVLSKAVPNPTANRKKRKDDDGDEDDSFGKNFKF